MTRATNGHGETTIVTNDLNVKRDSQGRLVVRGADGVEHVGVEPIRAFPITDPRKFISLRSQQGKEIAFAEDLDLLPEASREMIEFELLQREFMPLLLRIHRLTSDVPPFAWDVETDRGRTRFLVNSEDDIRRLGPDRFLVVDSDGIRYQIADYAKLDAHSRRLLDRVL